MVNNSKIKLMTKLAVYEKKHTFDFKLGKYFRSDYIKLNLLKTVLSVTAGYILCLLLVGFYNIEFLIKYAVKLDYKLYGIRILGIYIVLLIVFILSNMVRSNQTFIMSRKRLNRYYKRLKLLSKMYDNGNNENKQQ